MLHRSRKKASAQWVLEADIKPCYDEISHAWMIANIPTDKLSQQAVSWSNQPTSSRRAHSAVESAINGLEVHGLDMCAYSTQSGHPFHGKLATQSTPN